MWATQQVALLLWLQFFTPFLPPVTEGPGMRCGDEGQWVQQSDPPLTLGSVILWVTDSAINFPSLTSHPSSVKWG